MKLTDTTIEIRPRDTWESIDLGLLLARHHLALLLASWCLVTLPLFALLTACFWNAPLIPLLIWHIPLLPIIICWWLKPIFDRIPLYILSNVVMGHTPTIKTTLLFWVKSLLSVTTLTDLTIHRLSLRRSFNLAITQLEKLTGQARQHRQKNLLLTRPRAKWLTIIFINFEAILYTLLISLVFMMVPNSIYTEQGSAWSSAFLINLPAWLVHLNGALYLLAIAITEPLYVACGFCLYLNSRTLLDGWDIELAFRKLSQRLSHTLPTILVVIGLLFTGSFATFSKAETLPTIHIQLPNATTTAPTTAAHPTTALALATKASQQQIRQIIKSPPFYEEQTLTRYRWTKSLSAGFFSHILGWFFDDVFKILVWTIVITAIVLVAWQYRKQFALRVGAKPATTTAPKQLFGLSISPDSLPTDILLEFETLWQQGNTRQALSLLYRALLSYLVHRYQVPLKNSHTEGEVIRLASLLQIPLVTHFTEQLTHQWLLLAYGHHALDLTQKQQLTQGWQQLQQITVAGAKP